MAVFILQTDNASVSVNASLSSFRLKMGIGRMRREALYAFMRLQRRTKAFTACGRIMRPAKRFNEENKKPGTALPETSSIDAIFKFSGTFY